MVLNFTLPSACGWPMPAKAPPRYTRTAGASGAVKFGHAVTAATASDATVNVRLTQGLA